MKETHQHLIPRLSVTRPVTVVMVLLALLVVGTIAYVRIPLSLTPQGLEERWLGMWINYPNAGPIEVEQKIALKVEEALATVPRIRKIRTSSERNGCWTSVSFRQETDMREAYNQMRDRADRLLLELPDEVDHIWMRNWDPDDWPILWMGLYLDGEYADPQHLLETYVRPELQRIDGVGQLDIWGGPGKEVFIYTDQEKETSAAYNEFRRVNGTQNSLFMALDGLDGCGIVLSFGNSTERGGWGHDQIQAIRRLAPHLRQFARVRRKMANAEALGASLAELLENRGLGIIQLDRHGRILEANDRARDILLKRDGLRDGEGVLAARIRGEDAQLQRLLAQALPPYGVQGAGGSMRITRRKTQAPLVLEIHPVRGMGTDHLAWEVGALVVVVDPAARLRVDPDLAAAVLGLTPTESRVAVALATGQTVAGIADALDCAQSTVRTHLKRVYRKQGIRKQTELVQRVLSLEALRESFR